MADAYFIPQYFSAMAASEPAQTAYVVRADIGLGISDLDQYRVAGKPVDLQRAAYELASASGVLQDYALRYTDGTAEAFSEMLGNLSGDLAYGKDVLAASEVVRRIGTMWPMLVVAKDRTSQSAFDKSLGYVIRRLPGANSTPLY